MSARPAPPEGRGLVTGRVYGKTHRLALLSERADLRFAAVDDRWWKPRCRRRRLARLAAIEAALQRLS